MFGIENAMAQSANAASKTSGFLGFMPLLLIFVIIYFLIFRPQQKQQKQHREMIRNLKKGDRIITGGGLHGRITGMDDTTLTVEIADKVRVKINRGNVASIVQPGSKEQTPQK